MIIENIIAETNNYLKKSILKVSDNYGLYSGLNGLLLYERYFNLYTNGKELLHEKQLETFISDVLCYNNSSPVFSFGLSGKLWLFHNLNKNGLVEIGADELASYQQLLFKQLIEMAKKDEWDNLHGAFGILYFLLEAELINETELNFFLEIFKSVTYKNSDFKFYLSSESMNRPEKSFNLSLAHGIAGHIIILSKAIQLFKNNNLLLTVTEDMVNFLLKFKSGENHEWHFPLVVSMDHKSNHLIGRLAWCYGDLGAGLALLKYSAAISNPEIKKEALKILSDSAQKREMQACLITDTPLCHGTAGVMHIFNRLYFDTKINEFKNASDYWLAQTLNFYNQQGLNGFSSKCFGKEKDFELSPYFLTGVSGINLALLSKLFPAIEPTWDKCFLFS